MLGGRLAHLETLYFRGFYTQVFCATLGESAHDRVSSALALAGLVPPWVEAFCLLAIAGRVSTIDFLRRGLNPGISIVCVMCGVTEESTSHLFIHCDIASSIWSRVFR